MADEQTVDTQNLDADQAAQNCAWPRAVTATGVRQNTATPEPEAIYRQQALPLPRHIDRVIMQDDLALVK